MLNIYRHIPPVLAFILLLLPAGSLPLLPPVSLSKQNFARAVPGLSSSHLFTPRTHSIWLLSLSKPFSTSTLQSQIILVQLFCLSFAFNFPTHFLLLKAHSFPGSSDTTLLVFLLPLSLLFSQNPLQASLCLPQTHTQLLKVGSPGCGSRLPYLLHTFSPHDCILSRDFTH